MRFPHVTHLGMYVHLPTYMYIGSVYLYPSTLSLSLSSYVVILRIFRLVEPHKIYEG